VRRAQPSGLRSVVLPDGDEPTISIAPGMSHIERCFTLLDQDGSGFSLSEAGASTLIILCP